MTPQSFREFSRLLPQPLMLLERGGRILATSVRAGAEGIAVGPEHAMLHDVVKESPDHVRDYLARCARSAQPVIGALTFGSLDAADQAVACRCYGGAICEHGARVPARILIRLVIKGARAADSFASLTTRLGLDAQVHRRRWQAESQLREQQAEFSALLEATQDAVILVDQSHHILQLNRAAEQLFGPAADARGKDLRQLFFASQTSPSDHNDHNDLEALGRDSRVRELRVVRQDGREVPVEISSTKTAGRAAYGVFVRDISERKRLQQQLLDNERLAAIGTTAAKFAHEVGNPLNGMYMNVQLAERRAAKLRGTEGQAIADSLATIKVENRRLNALLNEFRSLSRRQTFQFTRVRLDELAASVVRREAAGYQELGIRVVVEPAPQPVWVRGDGDKLAQVLLNLCKNAVEAMPAGGALTVRVVTPTAGRANLEVEDTGNGIAAGVDVFEPFATTKPTGTGLGLPIARQIVAAHDGCLTHEPAGIVGTRFTISLTTLN